MQDVLIVEKYGVAWCAKCDSLSNGDVAPYVPVDSLQNSPLGRLRFDSPTAIRPSPTGLYWNMRGNIRCEAHGREIESDRWKAEGWQPIPQHEEPTKRHYQCQRCSPDGNPIATH